MTDIKVWINALHPKPSVMVLRLSTAVCGYGASVVESASYDNRRYRIHLENDESDEKELMQELLDQLPWIDSVAVDDKIRQNRNTNGMDFLTLAKIAAEKADYDPSDLGEIRHITTWRHNMVVFRFVNGNKFADVVYDINRDEWTC